MEQSKNTMQMTGKTYRPTGIVIIASLMILFGLAEMVTGFTHKFFGLSTNAGLASVYAGGVIGALYAVSGLLILTMKKRSAVIAEGCLIGVIIGRIALIATGVYPISSIRQIFAMATGTIIVIFFAGYIAAKWKYFN